MAKRKKKTTELDYWISGGAKPVFVIDAQRRLRVFNDACQNLTGWGAADIIGETCHYGSVSEIAGPAALAASLCPPPEVFAGAELAVAACLVDRNGRSLPRMLHFFPLRDEQGQTTAVMGVVSELPPGAAAGDESPSRKLHAELAALRAALRSRFGPSSLVARGAAMQRVLAQVELAQSSGVCVLLSGPAGAGKEHLARVIHFGSALKSSSFVPLDCRRLGAEEQNRIWNRMLDAHEASSRASGGPLPGSVLLADVEFVPRDLQERLLKVLSGAARPVRLLATTTLDLLQIEAHESLRPEFVALISPLLIRMPPLAQRIDDLPLLAQHVLEDLNRHDSRQIGGFDERVWPLMVRYAWPGNIDELGDVICEAHAHAAGSLIQPDDLPYRFRTALDAQESPPPRDPPPLLLDPLLTKVEMRLISLALERSRNNKSKAAELLGINRARLLRRIEQLDLNGGLVEEGGEGLDVVPEGPA